MPNLGYQASDIFQIWVTLNYDNLSGPINVTVGQHMSLSKINEQF